MLLVWMDGVAVAAIAGVCRVLNTVARARRDVLLAREQRSSLDATLRLLPAGAMVTERGAGGFERMILVSVHSAWPVVHVDDQCGRSE